MTHPAPRRRRVMLLVAASTLAFVHSTGLAVSWTFTGPLGTWQTGSNWSGGVAPNDSKTDATFNLGLTSSVNFVASATAQNLDVGTGTVTFDLAGNTLNLANALQVANSAGQNAAATIANGSVTCTASEIQGTSLVRIGWGGGVGHAGVRNGGKLTLGSNQALSVGDSRSGSAPGNESIGSLSITAGGQVSSGFVFVGDSGAVGHVAADGTNSLLTAGEICIGRNRYFPATAFAGNGSLSVTNGGEVRGETVLIGDAGGVGRASVDGTSSKISASGIMYVGDWRFPPNPAFESDGLVSITNGGQVDCGILLLGESGGRGRIEVGGTNSELNIATFMFVGDARYDSAAGHESNGTLSIADGGHVSVPTMYVGVDRGKGLLVASNGASIAAEDIVVGAIGGVGTMILAGSGVHCANTAGLSIGNDSIGAANTNGTGTLIINSGATLTNGGLLKVYPGGTVLFNGGTLTSASIDAFGGRVLLSTGGDKLLRAGAITTLAGNGTIDLADNDAHITGGSTYA